MPKQQSYHFSLGNSTDGPVGFCARITAASREQAASRLRQALDSLNGEHAVWGMGARGERPAHVEYLEVYFNADAITEADVDEVGG
jgi:hypothetical protein